MGTEISLALRSDEKSEYRKMRTCEARRKCDIVTKEGRWRRITQKVPRGHFMMGTHSEIGKLKK